MNVRYELTMACQCPVDDAQDIYAVTIEATKMIKVEDILAMVKALPPMFQEDITKRLAKAFDCRATTVGLHSGVKTTCSA